MSQSWTNQAVDIDGTPSRIMIRECYGREFVSAIPEVLVLPALIDSTFSPPLSVSELADIQVAEIEFSSGQTATYESAQDLITALHAVRERYKREVGGQ
jgi:hypothetical protein